MTRERFVTIDNDVVNGRSSVPTATAADLSIQCRRVTRVDGGRDGARGRLDGMLPLVAAVEEQAVTCRP